VRKITFGGACTLDHYLARPDGAVDWLLWGDEVSGITGPFWKTIDTVLMGRKTYEVARGMGQRDGYPGVANYVFSRSLPPQPGRVTVVSEDAAEFVGRLKEQDGRDICLIGGGELARPLFEAGLIDRVGLNIHPVLLGTGIPVFHPMTRQIGLELEECRPFTNGCVYVSYRVLS
jgi:dihydrofolate reductase